MEEMQKLYVKCFGNFEVFYEGYPVHFRYKKTKELLAYLIHRDGASCSMGEVTGILYEDRICSKSLQSHVRNLICDLHRTFSVLGAQQPIYRTYGALAILPDKIDCDYYDMKRDKNTGWNIYDGEYMAQYSWAEEKIAMLDQLTKWKNVV